MKYRFTAIEREVLIENKLPKILKIEARLKEKDKISCNKNPQAEVKVEWDRRAAKRGSSLKVAISFSIETGGN